MYKRSISFILTITFVFSLMTNFTFVSADASAAGFAKLNIPETIGQVVETFKGSGAQKVICIEDLHCDPEVQRNISKIIRAAQKEYGEDLDFIGIEGSTGEIDTSILGGVPDTGVRDTVTNKHVDNGDISGAELYTILYPKTVLLYGLEDPDLYEQDFGYLYNSYTFYSAWADIYSKLNNDLTRLREKAYPKPLKTFNKTMKQYHDENLSLDEYIVYLEETAGAQGVNIQYAYPEITKYYKAINLKNTPTSGNRQGNPYSLEKQISLVSQSLEEHLQQEETDTLEDLKTKNSITYVLYIKNLLDKYNIGLPAECSELSNYFSYLGIIDNINNIELLDEISDLEYEIGKSFANDNEDLEDLIFCSRYLDMLDQYLNNSIGKRGVDELEAMRDDFFSEMQHLKDFNIQNFIDNIDFINNIFNNMESFYTTAAKRNEALLDNFFNTSEKTKVKVIIFGGYHTEGMKEFLRNKGISYDIILPYATKPYDKTLYLNRIQDQGQAEGYSSTPTPANTQTTQNTTTNTLMARTKFDNDDYTHTVFEQVMTEFIVEYKASDDALANILEFYRQYNDQFGRRVRELISDFDTIIWEGIIGNEYYIFKQEQGKLKVTSYKTKSFLGMRSPTKESEQKIKEEKAGIQDPFTASQKKELSNAIAPNKAPKAIYKKGSKAVLEKQDPFRQIFRTAFPGLDNIVFQERTTEFDKIITPQIGSVIEYSNGFDSYEKVISLLYRQTFASLYALEKKQALDHTEATAQTIASFKKALNKDIKTLLENYPDLRQVFMFEILRNFSTGIADKDAVKTAEFYFSGLEQMRVLMELGFFQGADIQDLNKFGKIIGESKLNAAFYKEDQRSITHNKEKFIRDSALKLYRTMLDISKTVDSDMSAYLKNSLKSKLLIQMKDTLNQTRDVIAESSKVYRDTASKLGLDMYTCEANLLAGKSLPDIEIKPEDYDGKSFNELDPNDIYRLTLTSFFPKLAVLLYQNKINISLADTTALAAYQQGNATLDFVIKSFYDTAYTLFYELEDKKRKNLEDALSEDTKRLIDILPNMKTLLIVYILKQYSTAMQSEDKAIILKNLEIAVSIDNIFSKIIVEDFESITLNRKAKAEKLKESALSNYKDLINYIENIDKTLYDYLFADALIQTLVEDDKFTAFTAKLISAKLDTQMNLDNMQFKIITREDKLSLEEIDVSKEKKYCENVIDKNFDTQPYTILLALYDLQNFIEDNFGILVDTNELYKEFKGEDLSPTGHNSILKFSVFIRYLDKKRRQKRIQELNKAEDDETSIIVRDDILRLPKDDPLRILLRELNPNMDTLLFETKHSEAFLDVLKGGIDPLRATAAGFYEYNNYYVFLNFGFPSILNKLEKDYQNVPEKEITDFKKALTSDSIRLAEIIPDNKGKEITMLDILSNCLFSMRGLANFTPRSPTSSIQFLNRALDQLQVLITINMQDLYFSQEDLNGMRNAVAEYTKSLDDSDSDKQAILNSVTDITFNIYQRLVSNFSTLPYNQRRDFRSLINIIAMDNKPQTTDKIDKLGNIINKFTEKLYKPTSNMRSHTLKSILDDLKFLDYKILFFNPGQSFTDPKKVSPVKESSDPITKIFPQTAAILKTYTYTQYMSKGAEEKISFLSQAYTEGNIHLSLLADRFRNDCLDIIVNMKKDGSDASSNEDIERFDKAFLDDNNRLLNKEFKQDKKRFSEFTKNLNQQLNQQKETFYLNKNNYKNVKIINGKLWVSGRILGKHDPVRRLLCKLNPNMEALLFGETNPLFIDFINQQDIFYKLAGAATLISTERNYSAFSRVGRKLASQLLREEDLKKIGKKFEKALAEDNKRLAYIRPNGKEVDMLAVLEDCLSSISNTDFTKLTYFISFKYAVNRAYELIDINMLTPSYKLTLDNMRDSMKKALASYLEKDSEQNRLKVWGDITDLALGLYNDILEFSQAGSEYKILLDCFKLNVKSPEPEQAGYMLKIMKSFKTKLNTADNRKATEQLISDTIDEISPHAKELDMLNRLLVYLADPKDNNISLYNKSVEGLKKQAQTETEKVFFDIITYNVDQTENIINLITKYKDALDQNPDKPSQELMQESLRSMVLLITTEEFEDYIKDLKKKESEGFPKISETAIKESKENVNKVKNAKENKESFNIISAFEACTHPILTELFPDTIDIVANYYHNISAQEMLDFIDLTNDYILGKKSLSSLVNAFKNKMDSILIESKDPDLQKALIADNNRLLEFVEYEYKQAESDYYDYRHDLRRRKSKGKTYYKTTINNHRLELPEDIRFRKKLFGINPRVSKFLFETDHSMIFLEKLQDIAIGGSIGSRFKSNLIEALDLNQVYEYNNLLFEFLAKLNKSLDSNPLEQGLALDINNFKRALLEDVKERTYIRDTGEEMLVMGALKSCLSALYDPSNIHLFENALDQIDILINLEPKYIDFKAELDDMREYLVRRKNGETTKEIFRNQVLKSYNNIRIYYMQQTEYITLTRFLSGIYLDIDDLNTGTLVKDIKEAVTSFEEKLNQTYIYQSKPRSLEKAFNEIMNQFITEYPGRAFDPVIEGAYEKITEEAEASQVREEDINEEDIEKVKANIEVKGRNYVDFDWFITIAPILTKLFPEINKLLEEPKYKIYFDYFAFDGLNLRKKLKNYLDNPSQDSLAVFTDTLKEELYNIAKQVNEYDNAPEDAKKAFKKAFTDDIRSLDTSRLSKYVNNLDREAAREEVKKEENYTLQFELLKILNPEIYNLLIYQKLDEDFKKYIYQYFLPKLKNAAINFYENNDYYTFNEICIRFLQDLMYISRQEKRSRKVFRDDMQKFQAALDKDTKRLTEITPYGQEILMLDNLSADLSVIQGLQQLETRIRDDVNIDSLTFPYLLTAILRTHALIALELIFKSDFNDNVTKARKAMEKLKEYVAYKNKPYEERTEEETRSRKKAALENVRVLTDIMLEFYNDTLLSFATEIADPNFATAMTVAVPDFIGAHKKFVPNMTRIKLNLPLIHKLKQSLAQGTKPKSIIDGVIAMTIVLQNNNIDSYARFIADFSRESQYVYARFVRSDSMFTLLSDLDNTSSLSDSIVTKILARFGSYERQTILSSGENSELYRYLRDIQRYKKENDHKNLLITFYSLQRFLYKKLFIEISIDELFASFKGLYSLYEKIKRRNPAFSIGYYNDPYPNLTVNIKRDQIQTRIDPLDENPNLAQFYYQVALIFFQQFFPNTDRIIRDYGDNITQEEINKLISVISGYCSGDLRIVDVINEFEIILMAIQEKLVDDDGKLLDSLKQDNQYLIEQKIAGAKQRLETFKEEKEDYKEQYKKNLSTQNTIIKDNKLYLYVNDPLRILLRNISPDLDIFLFETTHSEDFCNILYEHKIILELRRAGDNFYDKNDFFAFTRAMSRFLYKLEGIQDIAQETVEFKEALGPDTKILVSAVPKGEDRLIFSVLNECLRGILSLDAGYDVFENANFNNFEEALYLVDFLNSLELIPSIEFAEGKSVKDIRREIQTYRQTNVLNTERKGVINRTRENALALYNNIILNSFPGIDERSPIFKLYLELISLHKIDQVKGTQKLILYFKGGSLDENSELYKYLKAINDFAAKNEHENLISTLYDLQKFLQDKFEINISIESFFASFTSLEAIYTRIKKLNPGLSLDYYTGYYKNLYPKDLELTESQKNKLKENLDLFKGNSSDPFSTFLEYTNTFLKKLFPETEEVLSQYSNNFTREERENLSDILIDYCLNNIRLIEVINAFETIFGDKDIPGHATDYSNLQQKARQKEKKEFYEFSREKLPELRRKESYAARESRRKLGEKLIYKKTIIENNRLQLDIADPLRSLLRAVNPNIDIFLFDREHNNEFCDILKNIHIIKKLSDAANKFYETNDAFVFNNAIVNSLLYDARSNDEIDDLNKALIADRKRFQYLIPNVKEILVLDTLSSCLEFIAQEEEEEEEDYFDGIIYRFEAALWRINNLITTDMLDRSTYDTRLEDIEKSLKDIREKSGRVAAIESAKSKTTDLYNNILSSFSDLQKDQLYKGWLSLIHLDPAQTPSIKAKKIREFIEDFKYRVYSQVEEPKTKEEKQKQEEIQKSSQLMIDIFGYEPEVYKELAKKAEEGILETGAEDPEDKKLLKFIVNSRKGDKGAENAKRLEEKEEEYKKDDKLKLSDDDPLKTLLHEMTPNIHNFLFNQQRSNEFLNLAKKEQLLAKLSIAGQNFYKDGNYYGFTNKAREFLNIFRIKLLESKDKKIRDSLKSEKQGLNTALLADNKRLAENLPRGKELLMLNNLYSYLDYLGNFFGDYKESSDKDFEIFQTKSEAVFTIITYLITELIDLDIIEESYKEPLSISKEEFTLHLKDMQELKASEKMGISFLRKVVWGHKPGDYKKKKEDLMGHSVTFVYNVYNNLVISLMMQETNMQVRTFLNAMILTDLAPGSTSKEVVNQKLYPLKNAIKTLQTDLNSVDQFEKVLKREENLFSRVKELIQTLLKEREEKVDPEIQIKVLDILESCLIEMRELSGYYDESNAWSDETEIEKIENFKKVVIEKFNNYNKLFEQAKDLVSQYNKEKVTEGLKKVEEEETGIKEVSTQDAKFLLALYLDNIKSEILNLYNMIVNVGGFGILAFKKEKGQSEFALIDSLLNEINMLRENLSSSESMLYQAQDIFKETVIKLIQILKGRAPTQPEIDLLSSREILASA